MHKDLKTPRHHYPLASIIELVDSYASPQDIDKNLEELDFAISQYALRDADSCGHPDLADHRYTLRAVREAFRAMTVPPEED